MKFLILALTVFYCILALPSDPVCTNGFTLVNNKCLKLFTNKVTYKDAEKNCLDLGATLVTSKNAVDNRAISSIAGSSAPLIWMGLYCMQSDPSRCLWDDSTGSAELYSNFASGFPHIDVGKCVYYSVQGALAGKWLSGDCLKDTNAYMCELPITHADDCQYNYNGHCFSFYDAPLQFAQAQEKCEAECGNLASITSALENRYLSTLASSLLTSYNVYIGGMWPLANVFSWIDGSAWAYNNIDPSMSHGPTCMAMSNYKSAVAPGYWFSMNCYQGNSFICKRPTGIKCPANQPIAPVTPVPVRPSFCNGTNLMAPGVISSSNFPLPYDPVKEYCVYQLTTLGSYNILLRFDDFATQSGSDVVNVYDGETTSSPLLGSFSGTKDAFSLVSTGNTMLVTFKSASGKSSPGFSARYSPYTHAR